MRTEPRALPDFNRQVHCLLGVPVDVVDLDDADARVRAAVRAGERFFLSTPNVNFLVSSRSDEGFRRSVLNSDLSVADGMPLVWLGRLLGVPLRERVAGASLFDALRRGPEPLRVYFFGGPEGAAEKAAQKLGVRCVGYAFPGYGSVESMSSDEAIADINASGADLLVVSLGARKGQAWIERNRARLQVPVVSHLGAVLGFAAGSLKRAPRWMQAAGLEWLWRIKEEPALWRRYAADGLALARLFATRALPYALHQRRRRRRHAVAGIEMHEEAERYVLRLRGSWPASRLGRLRRAFRIAARSGKHVRLEMARVTYVDTAFVGLVMLLEAHQQVVSRRFSIASLGDEARRVFNYCCAEYLYAAAPIAEKGSDPISLEDEALERNA